MVLLAVSTGRPVGVQTAASWPGFGHGCRPVRQLDVRSNTALNCSSGSADRGTTLALGDAGELEDARGPGVDDRRASRSPAKGGPAAPSSAAAGADRQRGADQRQVAEGLREVPQLAASRRVVLLRQQADVVAQVEQPLEHLPGL